MRQEAQPPLPERISILGSGWLGLPLARQLARAGYTVSASTTSADRIPQIEAAGANSFLIDISNINTELRKFIICDTLIVNIPSRDVESYSSFVEELELCGVKNVIYVSSTSVYPSNNSVISESDGLELPASPFLIIENLFRNSRRFRTTVLRFGGLIGYSRHPGRFFSQGRVLQNPDATVNLIHRDDCIGIIEAVIKQKAWGEVFNCCAETHPSRREFYGHAARSLGMPEPVFSDNGPMSYKTICSRKVRKVLEYRFSHPDLMKLDFAGHEP